MTRLADRSLADVLDAFTAPTPTPGGGSASALAGALGTSLLLMVAGMPKTKSGTQQDRDALDGVLRDLRLNRDHLLDSADRDAAAYDGVVAAYRLPKSTDDEKRERKGAIQAAMRAATEVPLDVMRACQVSAHFGITVAQCGNPSASSDLGVALELLAAASRGAAANVRTNLSSITDEGFTAGAEDEARRIEREMEEAIRQARAALG